MLDVLVSLVVDEGRWLPAAMSLAAICVAILLRTHRGVRARRRVLAAMNLFFGVTIGTMAFGHLLAVTVKLAMGTLRGPVPLFYAIGVALAVPSWLVIRHTRLVLASEDHGRATVGVNALLALTLVALGLPNVPLALPGVLNVAYQLHSRRVVGWAIVGTAAALNLALFVGALIFMASGQTFEEFSGDRAAPSALRSR